MLNFELERDGLGPLAFRGFCIAEVSTHRDGKQRWSEFRIFRTDRGVYVTEILGCSVVENERTMRTVRTAEAASELVRSFVHQNHGRISMPATDLLEMAATVDGEIDRALDAIYEAERI